MYTLHHTATHCNTRLQYVLKMTLYSYPFSAGGVSSVRGCVCACVCVHVYMYVYMYVCMYVCVERVL